MPFGMLIEISILSMIVVVVSQCLKASKVIAHLKKVKRKKLVLKISD